MGNLYRKRSDTLDSGELLSTEATTVLLGRTVDLTS
jgi:hypothetical protein